MTDASLWNRIHGWLAGHPADAARADPLLSIRDKHGTMLVDRATIKVATSVAPDPARRDLDALFQRARRLRVVERGRQGDTTVLYETNDADAIRALHGALAIVDDPASFGHCMCMGGPALEISDDAGVAATITLHHGRSIRWDAWKWDALLEDGTTLCAWLAERGVDGPQRELEQARQRAVVAAARLERWRHAMPPCLAPHWHTMMDFGVETSPLMAALREAYPAPQQRVRALFAWFGQGSGLWSGFPMYESVAESLLLLHSTTDLLAALDGGALDDATLDGAARLLGGWEFSRQRPGELARLPDDLRASLLARGLATESRDRQDRARHAFGATAGPT